jgi:hypothetical protein
MIERGVEEEEVIEAIRSGEELPAKRGRKKFRKNFSYGKEWGGHFYRTKQVVPVTVEEESVIIVVTVLSFYF